MKASMIRFAIKSYPLAVEENKALTRITLDCVPIKHAIARPGFPATPGWDASAYVSNLAQAMMHDYECEPRNPELSEFMKKIRCMNDQNRSTKDIAIQKKV